MLKYSQKSLVYKTLKNIQKNKLILSGQTVIVALSGGPDSVCLFDILFKLKDELGIKLLTCHYNHRLRGQDSYNDLEFVKKLTESRGVKCLVGEARKDSFFKSEDAARTARYEFFEKIFKVQGSSKDGVVIALAHNANDQVETFLSRIIRGTGLRGLKSIPYRRNFFIRPLLDFSRKEIEAYLEKEKLSYRIDKTNLDVSFDRNFIRLKILPLCLELNPNLIETVTNSVETINDDYDLLENLAEAAFLKIKISETKNSVMLNREKWLALNPSLQRLIIRIAISRVDNLVDITIKQLTEVITLIKNGTGKKFKLLPRSLRIGLEFGKIIIEK